MDCVVRVRQTAWTSSDSFATRPSTAGDGQVLSGVPKLPSEVVIATKADYVIGLLSGTRAELAARPSRYFLAASKYGLVPLAWSVTSTTRVISGAAPVMATSIPCVRVTGAMAQPWQPPLRRR